MWKRTCFLIRFSCCELTDMNTEKKSMKPLWRLKQYLHSLEKCVIN